MHFRTLLLMLPYVYLAAALVTFDTIRNLTAETNDARERITVVDGQSTSDGVGAVGIDLMMGETTKHAGHVPQQVLSGEVDSGEVEDVSCTVSSSWNIDALTWYIHQGMGGMSQVLDAVVVIITLFISVL
jgi:hypothetical protein